MQPPYQTKSLQTVQSMERAVQILDLDATLAAFELPPGLLYLNSAGQTPRLRAAQQAGKLALARAAQPWASSIREFLARPAGVRELAAELIGCRTADLALVTSVAYGSALAAANLPLRAGQRVLALAGEHPSNVNAWHVSCARHGAQLQQLQKDQRRGWTECVLDALDRDVAVVVAPACHWHDGALLDLVRIGAAARAVGAALVIDATQALGVIDLDLDAIDADFLLVAGQKWLLGAATLSYLYVAPRHQLGRPLEEHGWARSGGLNYGEPETTLPDYAEGAVRFDAGGIYASLALPMTEVGLLQLRAWGIACVRQRLGAWQQRLGEALAANAMGDWMTGRDSPHISALTPPGADATRCTGMASELSANGIVLAARGSGLRISPYLHSSAADAERLVAALRRWR